MSGGAPAAAFDARRGLVGGAHPGLRLPREDRIDAQAYNHVLWTGTLGDRPYPMARRVAERE
jgi:hypothetical protein